MKINQYLLDATSFFFIINTYLEQRTIFKLNHYTLVVSVAACSFTVFSLVPLDFRLGKKKYAFRLECNRIA